MYVDISMVLVITVTVVPLGGGQGILDDVGVNPKW